MPRTSRSRWKRAWSSASTRQRQGRVLVRPAGRGRIRPGAKYTRHPEAPAGHFRPSRSRAGHTFSRTQSNPFLHDLMPENEVWVNAATAAKLAEEREYVKLRNQNGCSATASRQARSASARTAFYMVYGFGHTNKMLKTPTCAAPAPAA